MSSFKTNDLSSRIRHVLLPTQLFASFQRHVRCETDIDVEVLGIGFGKDYGNAKKVNRIVIPDQQSTVTTCTATPARENQLVVE